MKQKKNLAPSDLKKLHFLFSYISFQIPFSLHNFVSFQLCLCVFCFIWFVYAIKVTFLYFSLFLTNKKNFLIYKVENRICIYVALLFLKKVYQLTRFAFRQMICATNKLFLIHILHERAG